MLTFASVPTTSCNWRRELNGLALNSISYAIRDPKYKEFCLPCIQASVA